MANQITCPKCGKLITDNPIIDSAANGNGLGSTFIICDCGERITFWAITAQLRAQKAPAQRFQNWLQGLFKRG
jgi:hypothetical protein